MLFGQETQHVTGYWWADAALWTAGGGLLVAAGATLSRVLTAVIDARKKLVGDKMAEKKEARTDAITERDQTIQRKNEELERLRALAEEERKRIEAERREERQRYDADRQADHTRFSGELSGVRTRCDNELKSVRDLNEKLQTQFNDAMTKIDSVRGEGHARANEFQKRLSQCQAEHMIAMRDIGALRTENAMLQSHINSVALQTGVTIPETGALGGVLTVGKDGIVREFSMALTPLLGWEPSDVIGKSVDMLIPERLHEEYRGVFDKAALSSFVTVPKNHVVEAWALTRVEKGAQREVAVTVTLRAWSEGGFISGTLRPRMVGPPPMGAKIEAAHPDMGK